MGHINRWADNPMTNYPLDEIKYQLCRKITLAIRNDRMTPKMAAAILGTSEATISRIHCNRIDKLSLSARPKFEILISI